MFTRYFEEQVLRKRPYLSRDMCRAAVESATAWVVQPDGRIRYWARILDERDDQMRYLRVVTLADGTTIHNAFFDRDFGKDSS